ncbi:AMP-binding protein [Gemmata sp. JC673]|uniref:AMP-binding protein n=1 Tax=Gemmata algarum TaxID=2975278 RepID=A0ABU5ERC8_9BACT|nr:AMP-binding protein [Gemmata algarum]MDY3557539.1 AMP-binding protein [Gemmata algarum]
MPSILLNTPSERLRGAQLDAVRHLLTRVLPGNVFYRRKFGALDPASLRTLDDFAQLPFTTKADLITDQVEQPPYGTNLSFPLDRYTRFHQTSGTTSGRPLHWLDTAETWDWLTGCWATNFALIGLRPTDRLFFPFSFGPFLGFWTAFEAAARCGFLVMPGGGLSSTARLRFLLDHRCTVLFATPTYALHLAEIASKEGIDLASSAVRALVVAGEPGGNIPGTRQRLEAVWGARVFDHYGMTEVGPVAVEAEGRPGELYLLESDYLAEVVDPQTGRPVPDGDTGELVLTNLGRTGSPLIRYRTGDLIRMAPAPDPTGRTWRRLEGGVLGRADDMIHVRGNNVYPGALESIIRRFADVAEYRIHVDRRNPLADLRLEIEPVAGDGRALAEEVGRAVRDALCFRIDVSAAPPGSLPRFEMKARRVVYQK